MEEEKQLVEQIRGFLKEIEKKAETLHGKDVTLSLTIGTVQKTVTFNTLEDVDMTLTAKINTDL